MATVKRKNSGSQAVFKDLQETLDAYRARRSAKKHRGRKTGYVRKNLYLSSANKIRLRVWAARLKTTRTELVNAILWDELLR